jgi:ElaB/YqjD/DUF883 family membrane-anchored ribosome-binding protein
MFRRNNPNHQDHHRTNNLHGMSQEVTTQVKDVVQKTWQNVEQNASEYYAQGRKTAGQWEQNLEKYIRQKPLPSLLLVAGISLLLGFFLKRD